MSGKRMRTTVGINKGTIITLLILSMVSVQVLGTGSGLTPDPNVIMQSSDSGASFAKAFATATKLDKGNYDLSTRSGWLEC